MTQSLIKKLLIISVLIFPGIVFAAPGIPHQFYGTVNFNNVSAPDGIMVQAKIDGEIIAECPVKGGEGKYGYEPVLCFVTDPSNDRAGKTIKFFINGINTDKTETFTNGALTKLDFNLDNVSFGMIEKGAEEILSSTRMIISPDSPGIIKMGNSINISLSSSVSTNVIVNKIEKLGTDFFTGVTAVISGKNILNGYEINISGDSVNISITMKYNDAGINEDSIAPYKFDQEQNKWVPITPYIQDKIANTITFSISSAQTPYVIFGSPSSSNNSSSGGDGGVSSSSNNNGGSGGGDVVSPSISEVNVKVTRTGAVITWKTDEPSISWLSYGITTDYGKEIKTTNYVTDHLVTIKDLSPNTTYHFQIKSKDLSGNIGSYKDESFTTLPKQKIGDINNDNKVDKYDFALMMSEWGKTGLNISSDLNNDGKVDKYDFSLLMANWNI